MNPEIKMSVSPLIRTKDKKVVYVMFQDEGKVAEIVLPERVVSNNKGFSQEELSQLLLYVENEQDKIMNLAKGVNPVKAMMQEK